MINILNTFLIHKSNQRLELNDMQTNWNVQKYVKNCYRVSTTLVKSAILNRYRTLLSSKQKMMPIRTLWLLEDNIWMIKHGCHSLIRLIQIIAHACLFEEYIKRTKSRCELFWQINHYSCGAISLHNCF